MDRKPAVKLTLEYLEDRTVPTVLAALADGNRLVFFDSATPSLTTSIPVTGLGPDETLSSIDRWSVNGQLYAVASRSEIRYSTFFGPFKVYQTSFYTINFLTGQATRVSGTSEDAVFAGDIDNGPANKFATLGSLNAANYLTTRVFDSHGVKNQLDTLQKAFYPDILKPSATQGVPGNITYGSSLVYAAGDANAGHSLTMTDVAVKVNTTLPTSFYLLDAQNGVLAQQTLSPYFVSPPNLVTTIGSLGISFSQDGGFDIAADGTAYAALTNSTGTSLYTINLTTGTATQVGTINGVTHVTGLVAIPDGDQNQAPLITGPRGVLGFEDTAFTYSAADNNSITVTDPDAAPGEIFTAEIHSVYFGPNFSPDQGAKYTLSTTAGLTFSQGDGTNDNHMIFTGTLAAINAALDGLQVQTLSANRFSYPDYPESWGQLRVSDTNTVHSGGAAVAVHDFRIAFQPVDDGPPIAKPYSLTLQPGQNYAQVGVFDTTTFGVDYDEPFLQKAKIVSVTPGVNGGITSFINPPPSQPYWATVYYERPAGFVGIDTFTYTITDGTTEVTATITVNALGTVAPPNAFIALGADTGNAPVVVVLDAQTQTQLSSFQAFNARFKGGVRVAVGDVNGDHQNDVVVAQARDGDGWVRAFTSSGQPLPGIWGQGFQPFGKTRQILEIAVGDINGDGIADLAVSGLNRRVPVIRFFDGSTATLLGERVQTGYRTFSSFTLADLNGDSQADLVVFSSDGRNTITKAYASGLGTALSVDNPFSNYAAQTNWRDISKRLTGISIAVGDLDGDGQADIMASVTTRSGVTQLRGQLSTLGVVTRSLQQPSRFRGSSNLNGRLALAKVDNDGQLDVLLGTTGGIGQAGNLFAYHSNLTDVLFSLPQNTRFNRGFSLAAN